MVITWTEAFDSFTAANVGWQDYDIFTNKGIPKGAVVEIICHNQEDDMENIMGVRTDGSGLNRYVELHEAEGLSTGGVHVTMLVTVHATTGLIETYTEDTANTTFYITGYWTGITFTERADIFQTTVDNVWTDKNLFADLAVPKGAVCQIHCYHERLNTTKYVGVRTDNSALSRYVSIHEAETAGTGTNGYTTWVKTSVADGIIDLDASTILNCYFMLLGYFPVANMDYVERWSNKAIADAAWVNVDLTANLDIDGRVVNFVLMHNATDADITIGARIDDSALARQIIEHEAETAGYTGFGITVQSATDDGVVELYATSNDYYYLAGYFVPIETAVGNPRGSGVSATTDALVAGKLFG